MADVETSLPLPRSPEPELPFLIAGEPAEKLSLNQGLIAVSKPSGMLVHNSQFAGPREDTLSDWIRKRHPAAVPLHRLDRSTSGIIFFAKNRDHAQAGQEALSEAEKDYLFVARGKLLAPIVLVHDIRTDEKIQHAVTQFTPLASSEDPRVCLVSAVPETGRRHQIRRHAKHLTHPLVGDVKYGKGPLNRFFRTEYGFHRLALHAREIRFSKTVTVSCPLPSGFRAMVAKVFGQKTLKTI